MQFYLFWTLVATFQVLYLKKYCQPWSAYYVCWNSCRLCLHVAIEVRLERFSYVWGYTGRAGFLVSRSLTLSSAPLWLPV